MQLALWSVQMHILEDILHGCEGPQRPAPWLCSGPPAASAEHPFPALWAAKPGLHTTPGWRTFSAKALSFQFMTRWSILTLLCA